MADDVSPTPPPSSADDLAGIYRNVFQVAPGATEYRGAEEFARTFKRCSLYEEECVSYSAASSS